MTVSDPSQRLAAARGTLAAVGQEHVLDQVDRLDAAGCDKLLAQIEAIDWTEVARLIESHVKRKPAIELPERIEPAPYEPYIPHGQQIARYDAARRTGEGLIREGKVAAFTVAGGQGTRLGWDGPKGTFPATPIRDWPLFGVFAEYILKTQRKHDAIVPWYVMTSPVNHESTLGFFEKHEYFGLDPAHVMFFPQAMMPAIDLDTARVLLSEPDSLALSPNGHGGSLKALWTSGAVNDMKQRGIEQISYTQVDNPLVRMVDPLFLGLHVDSDSQMSSKMLPKRDPAEKVGVFAMLDGKMGVIEYTNLPDELAHERTSGGELRFNAGSIAIHAMRVDFVEGLNTREGGFALPWNRAEKKVPYWDFESGRQVSPEKPNAVKLETFVFDALPFCDRSLVYETAREEEFAPIKNADGPGAKDTPSTSKAMQVKRAANWLERFDVEIPYDEHEQPEATIEIRGATAIEPDDLKEVEKPRRFEKGRSYLF